MLCGPRSDRQTYVAGSTVDYLRGSYPGFVAVNAKNKTTMETIKNKTGGYLGPDSISPEQSGQEGLKGGGSAPYKTNWGALS